MVLHVPADVQRDRVLAAVVRVRRRAQRVRHAHRFVAVVNVPLHLPGVCRVQALRLQDGEDEEEESGSGVGQRGGAEADADHPIRDEEAVGDHRQPHERTCWEDDHVEGHPGGLSERRVSDEPHLKVGRDVDVKRIVAEVFVVGAVVLFENLAQRHDHDHVGGNAK